MSLLASLKLQVTTLQVRVKYYESKMSDYSCLPFEILDHSVSSVAYTQANALIFTAQMTPVKFYCTVISDISQYLLVLSQFCL